MTLADVDVMPELETALRLGGVMSGVGVGVGVGIGAETVTEELVLAEPVSSSATLKPIVMVPLVLY